MDNTDRVLGTIPKPLQLNSGSGEFVLGPQTKIIAGPASKIIAESLLKSIIGISRIQPDIEIKPDLQGYAIIIGNSGQSIPKIEFSAESESYCIQADSNRVILSAFDRAGLFWAARTLIQLISNEGAIDESPQRPCIIPSVTIKDRPRFQRRSLLIDPVRTFIPMSYVKRLVALISDLKFNVLHFHLTDDQGWRYESKVKPRLHEVGGERGYYTQEQVRELVEYAAELNVEIMPEIDMPGHASAMIAAHPELSCRAKQIELPRRVGIFPYALCPAKERVYEFIESILGEAAELFTSPYIHVGSDEVLAYDWKHCPACRALMAERNLSDNRGLHGYFLDRVSAIVRKLDKRMIAWDEAASFAPPDTIIQGWRNIEEVGNAARLGFTTLSNANRSTYLNYSKFVMPLKKCYEYEPVPPGLTAEQERLIIGGGACMWGDYINSEKDIDRHLFPRLLAIAEVFWSPKDARNFSDFQKRLSILTPRIKAQGVEFDDDNISAAIDTARRYIRIINAGANMGVDIIRR